MVSYRLTHRPYEGELNVQSFLVGAKLQSLAATNASETYIIPQLFSPFDQFQLGSCVANAIIAMLMLLNNSTAMLSRLLLYYDARLRMGEQTKDNGCFIHLALDTLKDLGICKENDWPYLEDKVFTQPSQIAYKDADDNDGLAEYYQITTSGEQRLSDIETAIRANHPVVAGFAVGSEFENYTGQNDVALNPPSVKDTKGLHALLIVGVRKNAGQLEFYIRNSWGTGWGLQGYVWFSASYLLDSRTSDIFVGTKMNDLLS